MTGRLVLRLFLRRLVDNDVISPNADRHESLAVLWALVASLGVFVTFFMSTNYLAEFIQLPGPTALSALSDRFLYLSASMAVSALAALMVWDALAVETRDAAILGPLPIPAPTITRAKLAAAFVFGTAFAIGLNAVPSVLYPAFLTMNLRGMHGRVVLQLIAGHATSVVMAGLFGFFGVLAARGLCRLIAGASGFQRISSAVQSSLVVCTITALLLTPTVRKTVVREWIAGATTVRWPARPVLWYLGMNETLAGHLVAETPVVLPSRFSYGPYRERDEAGRRVYRALSPQFAVLAKRAWLSVIATACLGVAAFLWTNRRLPEQSTPGRRRSRLGAIARRIVESLTDGNREAQAGFFFAWRILTRSAPHRTIVAIAVAAGLTHLLMVLATSGVHTFELPPMPLGLFAIDLVMLASLVVGFRYAVTVPAESAAPNWTIRMAWSGDERSYLAGVKRAALVAVVVAPLLVLLPLNVALFGIAIAAVHSICSFMIATAALDVLFLGYKRFPFACSYVPIENPKVLWPAGFTGVLLATYGFANVERWAFHAPIRAAALGAALGGIIVLVNAVDRSMRRERRAVNFDEQPARATQRLGLFDQDA
jgi:hypothetical protein